MILGGFLSPIEGPLTSLLEWLHASVGLTWALSIIALTLLVRMAIVPLTVRQIHSMQKMQVLAPELKALQQKYKQDKRRQQEEVMRFYRENKVNPAASCLPLLLQAPVFIALFFVLRDFDEEVLPQYPGSDLSFLGIVPSITAEINSHWSGYLLLVLYAGSQLLSTLLMATTLDRTQRIIFIALPFVIIPFTLNFPTGLLLYWVTTNLWTMGQGIVTRRMIPKPAAPPKRSSRTPPKASPEPEAGGDGDGNGGQPATPAPKPVAPGERRVRRRKKRGPQARR